MTSRSSQQPEGDGRGVQYVFHVEQAIPEFDVRPGDRVVVTYGAAEPVTLVRPLPPNYGRLLGLLEVGALSVVEDDDSEAIRRMRRWAALERQLARLRLLL